MKRFVVVSLLATAVQMGCCLAGSLTITGPGTISDGTEADTKVMHRFFRELASDLTSGLANSPKSELNGDWTMTITLIHGSATIPMIQEQMEFELTGGSYKPIKVIVPYLYVQPKKPTELAGIIGKSLWNYMRTGKLENMPGLPRPQIAIFVRPPRRTFFVIKSEIWITYFLLSLSSSLPSLPGNCFGAKKRRSHSRRIRNRSFSSKTKSTN